MKKLIAILMMGMIAPAFATGTWTAVTVTHVWGCTLQQCTGGTGNATNQVQVQLSANATGTTACRNSIYNAWAVVDVSNASGAFTASQLESAFLSGATVTVYGVGSCNIFTGIETVGFVQQ